MRDTGAPPLNPNTPRVLVVDDDAVVLAALDAMLTPEFEVIVARNGRDGLKLVRRMAPDLVLLDVHMPDLDGLSVCQRIRDDPLTANLPVVLLSAQGNEAAEVAGFDAGASDFIAKPPRGPVVRARIRNLVQLKRMADQLRLASRTDALTGLANRAHFLPQLADELVRARRQRQPLALLMVDVDHFKAYNDHYGHLSGDGVLSRIGLLLRQCMRRAGDLAGRLGGEEFALLLPNAEGPGALAVARSLMNALANDRLPHAASPVADCVSLSIGVAVQLPLTEGDSGLGSLAPGGGTQLLERADAALYAAKRMGRNRVELEPGCA